MKSINIAIDGPSASGKSTVAKELCNKLNYRHLDTGAMYRCVALKVKQTRVDINDESKLLHLLKNIEINFDEKGNVYLDGNDVSKEIRTDDISLLASDVSTKAIVRHHLVKLQQEIAKDKGFIMDGRDIATAVLPDAELKIFLTASVETRAMRRYQENLHKGLKSNLQTLKNEIVERDYQDMHRKHSPLIKVSDAVLIDSSDMSKEEVVEYIMGLIEDILKE